jgi:hypothetical protein
MPTSPHARRISAQLLSGTPEASPVGVVTRLLAVQAQDGRGARLAVRARSTGLSAADVDRALSKERSLLVTWLNRGTLHLVRREDHGWLHALTTPQLLTQNLRRLGQEGVSPDAAERGVAVIDRALAEDGPLTRDQLRDRVAAAGVETRRQAMVHLLFLATLRGHILRGPMAGKHHAFARVEDWLGAPIAPVDRAVALAELARRYLIGHGPATAADLAKWAGVTLGDARRGLSAIAPELWQGDSGLVDIAGRPEAAPLPPPRLLGPFDPLLLGWASREDVLGKNQGVVTSNGIFRAFALVEGRAVATWSLAGGELTLSPFSRLPCAQKAALEADAADVLRFLGDQAGEVEED